jgi:hypothetical protein
VRGAARTDQIDTADAAYLRAGTALTTGGVLFVTREYAQLPMAYDAETQIKGMDSKHDKAHLVGKTKNAQSPPPINPSANGASSTSNPLDGSANQGSIADL